MKQSNKEIDHQSGQWAFKEPFSKSVWAQRTLESSGQRLQRPDLFLDGITLKV